MTGVLEGFAVIVAIIAVGYVLGRTKVLGPSGPEVLSRLAFWVASPALMFVVLARADLAVVLSTPLIATIIATFITAVLFVITGLFRRWQGSYIVLGALGSSYVNAGNLGLPIASYVLGDASLVAPVLLFQMLIVGPISLTALDVLTGEKGQPFWRRLVTPLINPITAASLAGVAIAASGWEPPAPVLEPFQLIGNMAIPAVLIVFGISLHGSTLPGRGPDRRPMLLAVALKSLVQPALAFAAGKWLLGLESFDLFVVVVLASLPTAQNILTYALRYQAAQVLVREVIMVTTALSLPMLVLVAGLLG